MCGLAGVGVCGQAGVGVCGLAGVCVWASWGGRVRGLAVVGRCVD